jgi:hypothetical protein
VDIADLKVEEVVPQSVLHSSRTAASVPIYSLRLLPLLLYHLLLLLLL